MNRDLSHGYHRLLFKKLGPGKQHVSLKIKNTQGTGNECATVVKRKKYQLKAGYFAETKEVTNNFDS